MKASSLIAAMIVCAAIWCACLFTLSVSLNMVKEIFG